MAPECAVYLRQYLEEESACVFSMILADVTKIQLLFSHILRSKVLQRGNGVQVFLQISQTPATICPILESQSSLVTQVDKVMSEVEIPISYVPFQEMRCVLHWFSGWTELQRERFLQDLVCKTVPGKLCLLLDGLDSLQLSAPPPNLFQCQLRLWDQWFQSWDEDERNEFLRRLEEQDPSFVARFYREVAGTAGKD